MRPILNAIRDMFAVFFDALTFVRLYFRSTAALAAENLFLRKQLGLFVERKVPTSTSHGRDPFDSCPIFPMLRLAERRHRRQTRHLDSLASQGVSPVLEMEIPAARPAVCACECAEVDR